MSEFAAHITLSDTAEHFLSKLAEALVLGTAELSQLPPSLMAFYTFAYEAGRTSGAESRQPEIDRLNDECDRLYLRAYNTPKQLKEIERSRVDEGLAAYTAAFFADAPQITEESRTA